MKNVDSKMVSITLPEDVFQRIEELRGDVSRSRFVLRLLEKGLERTKK